MEENIVNIKKGSVADKVAHRTSGGEPEKSASHYEEQLERLFEIGIALSSETELDELLEMILEETMIATNADGGTIYIKKGNELHFELLHNKTQDTHMGGTTGKITHLPPIPLIEENVSAYVALTGETVNIEDVYEAKAFDFTGPKKYDQEFGYKTKSMLVVPLKNQDQDIIGVLQLINSTGTNGVVDEFDAREIKLAQSLASQAAVALTNAQHIKDMKELFDSFVKVMATAIDERSAHTAGHIGRVAKMGLEMCKIINRTIDGPFADLRYSDKDLEEMEVAGWMHDMGKVTTERHILDKPTKLETIHDRIETITYRFSFIEMAIRNEWVMQKLEMFQKGAKEEEIKKGDDESEAKLAALRDDLAFIVKTNIGGEFMEDEKLGRLDKIASNSFKFNGEDRPYLTEDEVKNLSIRKGTLLDSEIEHMRDHIRLTIKMLTQVPFPKHLSNVPYIAGSHHECLDGSGYPSGMTGDMLDTRARILHIVDVYDALTASDRPYRKAMPLERALDILGKEADAGKIDKNLVNLFISSGAPAIFDKMFYKKDPKIEE